LELLQKTVRSLETAQSQGQFLENLAAIEQRAETAFAAYEAAMQEKEQMGVQPPQQPPQQDESGHVRVENEAQWQSLPPGTMYIAPDGSLRTKQ
jgi:hypothetical protein